jgi:osmotically-inducible protein OsmY
LELAGGGWRRVIVRETNADGLSRRESGENAPEILIVGQHPDLASIAALLGSSNCRVHPVEDVDSALDEMGAKTAAVVIAPPVGDVPVTKVVHVVAPTPEARDSILIYVVGSGQLTDSLARSLYLTGVAGVFEWPRDSHLLARMVRERLEAARNRRGSADSFARAVRTRLGDVSTRRPACGLRVGVRGGLARLSGRVDSLLARLKLAERAEQTPGIERVAAEEMAVEPSGHSDGEIAASVRPLLRGAAGIEHHTLTVVVHDGYVTALGWVEGPEEQAHLFELIGLTEGVRGVNDRTEVDPPAKHRDVLRARALEKEIAERFSAVDVHVAVMGDAAVLDGRVPRPSVKLAIQSMVYAHPFAKVLNRIAMRPSD